MSERAQELMNAIWEARNSGNIETEEQLVSAILTIAAEKVKFYNAQTGAIVLDKNDLLQFAEELNE